MSHLGITIDGKHTATEWGLRLVSYDIPMPEAKASYIEVPFRDGVIDLTESLDGAVRYKNRTLTFTFDLPADYPNWHKKYSQLAAAYHGKRCQIQLDTDREYLYEGRVSVQSVKENGVFSAVTLTMYADPYKYDFLPSDSDWLWDPFSFETGIIRSYKELPVFGTATYTVIGADQVLVPELICSAAMTVTADGKTVKLKKGSNRTSDIRVQPGENTFVFQGIGKVTIKFRGCKL